MIINPGFYCDPKSGLYLRPDDLPPPDATTGLSEAETAKRMKLMDTHFLTRYRVPLPAVFLRRTKDGEAKHEYFTRVYYLMERDRMQASFTAAAIFQRWERFAKDTDWPQISGETLAEEVTSQEWEKAYSEAKRGDRWWFRQTLLLGPGVKPEIPVSFTYVTDSDASRLQANPDEFVNIDNVYRRVEME